MNKLNIYEFNLIYDLVSLIDGHVKAGSPFFNYDIDKFIECATIFSKFTLLHLYIITTALNYYHKDFKKNASCIEEENLEYWYDLFKTYNINYSEYKYKSKNQIYNWFKNNENSFVNLFSEQAKEAFYIFFSNRNFLFQFNKIVCNADFIDLIPKEQLSKKGTIKRKNIPAWLKKAVFHRDKGRCVYCNCDLTNIYSTLNNVNYDHMIPLSLMGVNDPCNIQLTCENCNKQKGNKKKSTSNLYIPWW